MQVNFRNTFLIALFSFCSSFIYGQTGQIQVSFSDWTQRGDSDNGNWVYDSDNESLKQTTNSDPTFYVSNENYINKVVEGVFKVATTDDDDFVGFVLGFESAVDDSGSVNKFLLVDWKQGDQNYTDYGGYSYAEMRFSYFDTTLSDNSIFWKTQAARDGNTWGVIDTFEPSSSFTGVNSQGGWVDNFTYSFKVVYTESNVKIYFDFGNGTYTKAVSYTHL
ncbi:MAG: hypothetical protein KIH80_001360, partial [Flavobacteriia bacterium]|nr:hypothetical protein [Flavobacteriia bacterium]